MNIKTLKILLDSIGVAAKHPLSIVLFALVMICWLISFLLKNPYNLLDKFNKKDRLKVLRLSEFHQPYFKIVRIGIYLLTLITLMGLVVYYNGENNKTTKLLKISGIATLDNKPLVNSKISIIGVDGQWDTNSFGIFNFVINDTFKSDSITLVVAYSTQTNCEIFYDTTLNKNSLNKIQIRRVNPRKFTISGTVIDAINNKPISGATVKIIGEENFAITSKSGEFKLEVNFSEGQIVHMQVLKGNHVGYDDYVILGIPITIPFRQGSS